MPGKRRWVFFCLFLLVFLGFRQTVMADQLEDLIERIATKWSLEPEFFWDSPVYKPYCTENVLIYGFGSSPYLQIGANDLLYYTYSNPTVFFLPVRHQGGRFSLYVFYHGLEPVTKIRLSLDNKSYILIPEEPTSEYIYNAYLETRPVWNSGLVLTTIVEPGQRYLKLEADHNELLLAKVVFEEKSKANIKPKTPVQTGTKMATKPTTSVTDDKPLEGGLVLITPKAGEAWPRYTSTKLGFSIAYPKDWSYKEGLDQSLLELLPPSGEKKIIVTRDLLSSKSLLEFVLQMENVVGMKTIRRDKLQGERILQSAEVTIGEMVFCLDILYASANNYVYTVTAIAPKQAQNDYQTEVNDILLSFSAF